MNNKVELLLNKIGEDLALKGFDKESWKKLCVESNNYKNYIESDTKRNSLLSKSTGWTIYFSECHSKKISRKTAAENWNNLSDFEKNKYEEHAKTVTIDKLVGWREDMKKMKKKSIDELSSQFDSSSDILLLSKNDLQLMVAHLGYCMIIDSTTSKKILQAIVAYKLYGIEKAKLIVENKYITKLLSLFKLNQPTKNNNFNSGEHTAKDEYTSKHAVNDNDINVDKNNADTDELFYDTNNDDTQFEMDTFDDYGDTLNKKELQSTFNKLLKNDIMNILRNNKIVFEEKETKKDLIKKCISNRVKY
tara:strand:+ start:2089 stop:3003 length:915 start_codon:yes stop_codon:yes gene_type:complete